MRPERPSLPRNYKRKEAEGKKIRVLALAFFRDARNLSTTSVLNHLISEDRYLILHDLKSSKDLVRLNDQYVIFDLNEKK